MSPMAQPLPQTTKLDGATLEGTMRYTQRDRVNESRRVDAQNPTASNPDRLFVAYVPAVFAPAKPVEGKSAKAKMAEMLERVKAKAVVPVRRRMRGKQPPCKSNS